MGPSIIARNYAETLLTLAQQQGGVEAVDVYGRAIDDVAELLRREPRVGAFLETPRVDLEAKKRAVRASFGGRVPEYFLRFLLIVVEKRRQGLLRQIATEYHALVDEERNRVRAEVSLAQAATPELEREIVASLERRLGKAVIATFRVEPELIGGVVIRVGERILDGSIRRKLVSLRRRMLEVPLPAAAQG